MVLVGEWVAECLHRMYKNIMSEIWRRDDDIVAMLQNIPSSDGFDDTLKSGKPYKFRKTRSTSRVA